MDQGAVFTATVLAIVISTLLVALWANLPVALAPGMGLNAFFAYVLVNGMGFSWPEALAILLIEGLLFLLIALFNIRDLIVDSIPLNIKKAISVGIGLFIAFIGLYNSRIIVSASGQPLKLGQVSNPEFMLGAIGIALVSIMLARKVRGSLLLTIFTVTLLGIPFHVTHVPENFFLFEMPPSLDPIFFKFDFHRLFSFKAATVILSILLINIFDTLGTLLGVFENLGGLDKMQIKKAMVAGGIGTTIAPILGTSTVTAYIESASGVSEGGRTGLTSLFVALFFLAVLFFAPVFQIIPTVATGPILVAVGIFMIKPIKEIDFRDYTEAIPAFITILMMPLTYSISHGIMLGIILYVLLKCATQQFSSIPKFLYFIAAFFALDLIFG